MIAIFKLDELKTFENDLKQLLSVDKKYLPISKKWVAFLRELNPYLDQMQSILNVKQQNYLNKSVEINQHFAEQTDNYHQSLQLLLNKNNDEIEKAKKERNVKVQELNLNFKALLEQLELKITEAKNRFEDQKKAIETSHKRDVSALVKRMNESKKTYLETTTAIENEKEESIKIAKTTYDQKMNEIELLQVEEDQKVNLAIEDIKKSMQDISAENDMVYLDIKNNYQQLSIHSNKKINELKKSYQVALNSIEKDYQVKIKPYQDAIEKLKTNYHDAQQKVLTNYTEKLNSLNVIFDVQKTTYESKKEKIIKEINDAITLLNSKLSAYRETIAKEKLETSREMRNQMKSIADVNDREKMNHQLTRKLNAIDQDLNKQIIRTNKDILEKHRDQQRRLFNLDQQHLREINEWRLKKTLFEYEKKQEFAKIDLNFHHNMEISESQLKNMQSQHEMHKSILLHTHHKDLLKLEYQLAIAALLQERELNLLGNDAHLLIAETKLKEALVKNEFKEKEAYFSYQKKLAEALYHADTQVLNITIQLEMEKAKTRRDYELSEQDLKIELSKLILQKSTASLQFDLDTSLKEIELERQIHYLENKETLESYKDDMQLEIKKRQFIMNEAKYKNQERLSDEKSYRLIHTYQNELELNQEQTLSFLSITRKFEHIEQQFKKAWLELYHLPSHPEVLKGVLNVHIKLQEYLSKSLITILEEFQAKDQSFYMKKIEDMTGYKYMLKHENLMNFFDSEIQKVEEKRLALETDIRQLEETMLTHETEIERHHAFMTQLGKITQEIKSNTLKSDHKHHDIKENQKLISNHELEIKRIKETISRIQKDIDHKQKLFIPLDDQLSKLKNKQQETEDKLSSTKHDEAKIFYKYLEKNQSLYQSFAVSISELCKHYIHFYQVLSEEVYLSDNFIVQLQKKLDIEIFKYQKTTQNHQLKFLNLMLDFFLYHKKEQEDLIKEFKASTTSLVKSLNQTYQQQQKDLKEHQIRRIQEKDQLIKIEKEKAHKKYEFDQMTFTKKQALDQSTLKLIETKISENDKKRKSELQLLNDNQLSIALQYKQEYDHSSTQALESYQKIKQELSIEQDNLNKNHQSLALQLETKNQLLISKYTQSYEKNLSALSSRSIHYDESILKERQSQSLKEKNLEQTIKRMNKRREAELKNIQMHGKKFEITSRSDQNQMMNKEVKILKKSYRFKLKMLKLN